MGKICPGCGSSLQETFKFCPSCGSYLQKLPVSDEQETQDTSVTSEKVIVCNNCGGEISAESSVCELCGIKLSGRGVVRESAVKVTSEKPVRKHDVSSKPSAEKIKSVKKPQQVVSKGKELDLKQVWIIIGVVAGVGLILLYAAGVFDKPSSVQQTGFSPGQTQESGIDLSNLQLINELEAKYKANPSDNETLLQLAHLRQDSGLYEQAILNYQEYLSKVPDNADARIDMGVCYYSLRRYDEAIKEMTKALEYSPRHQIGHLNLGIVNLAANNIAKSKEWLQKAVDLNPDTDIGKRAQELLGTH